MQEIFVQEFLEDIDSNQGLGRKKFLDLIQNFSDGKISIDEYINDLTDDFDPSDGEVNWVQREKKLFSTIRDQDGDEFMDFMEVKVIFYNLK